MESDASNSLNAAAPAKKRGIFGNPDAVTPSGTANKSSLPHQHASQTATQPAVLAPSKPASSGSRVVEELEMQLLRTRMEVEELSACSRELAAAGDAMQNRMAQFGNPGSVASQADQSEVNLEVVMMEKRIQALNNERVSIDAVLQDRMLMLEDLDNKLRELMSTQEMAPVDQPENREAQPPVVKPEESLPSSIETTLMYEEKLMVIQNMRDELMEKMENLKHTLERLCRARAMQEAQARELRETLLELSTFRVKKRSTTSDDPESEELHMKREDQALAMETEDVDSALLELEAAALEMTTEENRLEDMIASLEMNLDELSTQYEVAKYELARAQTSGAAGSSI